MLRNGALVVILRRNLLGDPGHFLDREVERDWNGLRKYGGLRSLKFRASTKKTLMSASRTTPLPSLTSARSRKEEMEENFCRVERRYGSFTSSVTLPSSVDPVQVSAHYDKGVLKTSLAKKAEAKPKQSKVM